MQKYKKKMFTNQVAFPVKNALTFNLLIYYLNLLIIKLLFLNFHIYYSINYFQQHNSNISHIY